MLDKGRIKQVNHIYLSELLNVLSVYKYSYIFLLGMYHKELIHHDSFIRLWSDWNKKWSF